MTARRFFKPFYLPLSFILVAAALFLTFTPVHAEGETPGETPVVVEPAPVETGGEAAPADIGGGSSEAAPVSDEVAPASDEAAPASDEATPASDEVAPASDEVAPASDEVAPASDEAAPASDEVAPASDEAAPVSDEVAPASDEVAPASDEVAPAPILEVVDLNGDPLPLVTLQAAEALVSPDPYFYIGAVKYEFKIAVPADPLKEDGDSCGVTCWYYYNPIQSAVNYLATNHLTPTGGKITVEAGNYDVASHGNVFIDGDAWDTAIDYTPASLWLFGESGSGATTINGSISVTNMKSFTLQGFTFTGDVTALVYFGQNTGPLNLTDLDITNSGADGWGLFVDNNNGAVNLNMVDSINNGGVGAQLINILGAATPITVKNSAFNHNDGEGLYIESNAPVTLNGVTASNNGEYNGASVLSKGLTVMQSTFNNNTGDGLSVTSLGGVISIANSQFNQNSGSGFVASSYGGDTKAIINVTMTNIGASANGGYGVWVDTCNWNGTSCDNPFTSTFAITQASLTGNGQTVDYSSGLEVYAKGSITVTDVFSGYNGKAGTGASGSATVGYGAALYNDAVTAPVTVTDSSFFNNAGPGLDIFSNGAVTLKDTSAGNNVVNDPDHTGLDDGAFIDTLGSVSILNSADVVNAFDNNGSDGLEIYSNGIVLLNAVSANDNSEEGIHVQNDWGTGAVTIDGVSGTSASNNGWSGIVVTSKGAITIKNMDAEYNYFGLDLYNADSPSAAGINVLTTLTNWWNSYSNNGSNGMNILSKGNIVIQKSYAEGNAHYGAYLVNNFTGSIGNVTITDADFNWNALVDNDPDEYGLYVLSNGSISLTRVWAEGNGNDPVIGNGACLDNCNWDSVDNHCDNTTAKTVTITQGGFNDNLGHGLDVVSKGNITITASEAQNNGIYGMDLNNYNGVSGTATVIVTGTPAWWRNISDNGDSGLTITSNGAVTLSYLNLQNNAFTNPGWGLKVFTNGAISLSNVRASNNGFWDWGIPDPASTKVDGYGAWLYNSDALTPQAVTITSCNFNNNTTYGLEVDAKGNIAISASEAQHNGTYGMDLDNDLGSGSVSVAGTPTWWRNISNNGERDRASGLYGLTISSNGAVTLSYLQLRNNTTYGADIDTVGATAAVTITSCDFNDNTIYGLDVDAKGNISLTDVQVSWNVPGEVNTQYIAKWVGSTSTWSALGTGMDGEVYALAVASGGTLYAGGLFTTAGGVAANNIAQWGGTTWSALGDGMDDAVYALAVASGGTLYAGGLFTTAGVVDANYIAKWDGSAWSALEDGMDGAVYDLALTSDDTTLYVGGSFTHADGDDANYIAKWVGSAWSALGTGMNGAVNDLAVTSDGTLYAGGDFTTAGSVDANYIAKWAGSTPTWSALGDGMDNTVWALALTSDATTLYAGGSFTTAGVVVANNIAQWDGTDWSPLGTGMNGGVYALALNSDDTLFAGGSFTTAGVVVANNIAQWDGTDWSPLDTGMDGAVYEHALTSDDTTLYTGGCFTAAYNGGYGANLDNHLGTGTVTVNSTNGNSIDNNGSYGLWVISKGNITVTNVDVCDNSGFGAWLDNSGALTPQAVTISTPNPNLLWGNNGGYGLQVDSKGAISLTNIELYDNTTYGADLSNSTYTGPTPPGVTIINTWIDYTQAGDGLNVNSKGNITLTNVGAGDNAGFGAQLNNGGTGTGTVSVSGVSADDKRWFGRNGDFGLDILSKGAVTVKFVDVNNNATYGASIDNSAYSGLTPPGVTITSAGFNNNAFEVANFGLHVDSMGAISLTQVSVSGNGYLGKDPAEVSNGAELDNSSYSGSTPPGVTLNQSSFDGNVGNGLDVQSKGLITLTDASSSNNGGYGADLFNDYPGATLGVTISKSALYVAGYFWSNGEYGLQVNTRGAISLSYVTVSNNGDYGASIINTNVTTPLGVTINKSSFNGNRSGTGLDVQSKGAISLTYSAANNNFAAGAELYNHTSTSQNVTVTFSDFSFNQAGNGLDVLTKGNVLLTNLSGTGNFANAINVDAATTPGSIGTITMDGLKNKFYSNGANGVVLAANKIVSVTNIIAEGNKAAGLKIDTYNGGTGAISVTNANLNRNGVNGLTAKASNAAITLTNVTALSNIGDGANLTAFCSGTHKLFHNHNITITNSSFMNNTGWGINSDTGPNATLTLTGTHFFGNAAGNISKTGFLRIDGILIIHIH